MASACLLVGFAWAQTAPPRAMWLWDPAPLLDDAAARRDFFAFCERHRIGIVWAQIATRANVDRRQLDRASDWKALIADAHRRDMKVHALDGDPHYVLRDQHALVLSTLDAVAAYNTAAAANERFDGVHFDNEPYVLLDWRDPRLRERLLEDYLDLNARAAAAARAAGLAYGVDIPFWWGSIDEVTGEPTGIVSFRGTRQAASDHLLAIVDNLGIMDYRTTAAGPDASSRTRPIRFRKPNARHTRAFTSASRRRSSAASTGSSLASHATLSMPLSCRAHHPPLSSNAIG